MSGEDDKNKDKKGQGPKVVPFPFSRVTPATYSETYNNLGSGKLAETLGAPKEQQSGHWCSRCKGIWFGYLLEVECPKCGNRHG